MEMGWTTMIYVEDDENDENDETDPFLPSLHMSVSPRAARNAVSESNRSQTHDQGGEKSEKETRDVKSYHSLLQ